MIVPSSKMLRLSGRAGPLLLGLSLWDCTGTETGNPTVGKVRLGLSSSDTALVAVGDDAELDLAQLRLTEAQVGLGSIAFLSCEGDETFVLEETQVVDLQAGAPLADVPKGTFCGVTFRLVPEQLGVASLDPTLEGEPQSVTLRFTNQEGGVASMETSEITTVELLSLDRPFVLAGTEELAVFIDVAALALAHGLDQPLGTGVHVIDPNETADATEPSPLITSSSLVDLQGDELVSGHMAL